MDYNRAAANALRLITKNGRGITLTKLSGAITDASKPWRIGGAPIDIEPVETFGVFAIGNTSIPTESRGLAYDWVDNELLKVARHVVLVPAKGLPIMDEYKTLIDHTNNNGRWNIIWGQCLQPANTRLLYCFGLKE